MPANQLSLFEAVASVYAEAEGRPVSNDTLYETVARRLNVPAEAVHKTSPVGRRRQPVSLFKRRVRWVQQSLKKMGIITRITDGRSLWQYTGTPRKALHPPRKGAALLGFSTRLGIAVWGDCTSVLQGLGEPVHLCITSPPYPLRHPRAYGNPAGEQEYIDFICRAMEPVVRHLAPGGSIALNVGNDIFEPGQPSRSLYRERLLLTLCERFGLAKMDEIIWHNPSKPPAPTQWACTKYRVQLRAGYEPVYWLTNDPGRVRADNRRVLQAHTPRQRQIIERGGEAHGYTSPDGSWRRRKGAFGNPTPGRIPTNVLSISHTCAANNTYRRQARALGLPVHGATFPLALASFLIRFLSEDGDLVIDPFAGSFTAGLAAEQAGRRWIGVELMREYLAGAAERFRHLPGFAPGPLLEACA